MRLFQMYKDQMGDQLHKMWAEKAQFVDVSSVARWFYEVSERDEYDLKNDFPSLVMPWPLTWMEYKHPSTMRIWSEVRSNPLARKLAGAMLFCQPFEDGEKMLRDDAMAEWVNLQLSATKQPITNPYRDTQSEEKERRQKLDAMIAAEQFPKWLLSITTIQEVSNGHIALMGMMYLYLDELGQAYADVAMTLTSPILKDSEVFFTPFAFAISLMHCKNVKLEDVLVPPKVQKAREKRGIPNITFKTLIVEPLRQQVRREAVDDPTGEQNHIERALHIARGHFKDYRDGPGLFGKYQGLYWWDMHVRGKAEAGIVVKDYQVKR